MQGLEGKVAIVTGAARGMGRCAAERLVAEGARVLLGDVLVDDGKQVADDLGDAALFTELDVTDASSWEAAVALAEQHFGQVDILVNNAGILAFGLIADMPLEDYRRVIDVNQVGVFLGMKYVVPAMKRAGGGAIVNVSSVEGLGGGAYLAAYTASKFAVRGMTKAAAWELGGDGIRVNSVHPGAIRTPMVLSQTGGAEDAEKFIAKKTALKRMGEPEQVAAVMVFLASDDAAYMTGSEVAVDGGVSAGSGFAE